MLKSVLDSESLFLRNLSELGFLNVTAGGVSESVRESLLVAQRVSLVLKKMKKDLALFLVKGSKNRHEVFELLLVFSVLLILSFGSVIHLLNQSLELLALGVHGLQKVLRDELLIVELSDFVFSVKSQSVEVVPLFAVHVTEDGPLLLALLWLGHLASLG